MLAEHGVGPRESRPDGGRREDGPRRGRRLAEHEIVEERGVRRVERGRRCGRDEGGGRLVGREIGPGDERSNPNGSLRAIAGVLNPAGNVAGLMPHPERAAESVLGNDAGLVIICSLVEAAAEREMAAGPALVGTTG